MFQYPQQNAKEKKTLQVENVKILYHLQSSLTNASFLRLTLFELNLSTLHQVFVCGTYVFSQLRQFWDSLQSKIARDSPYIAIGGMRLQLSELQDNDKEAKLFRGSVGLLKDWKDIERVFQYRRLLYVPKIIRSKMITCYHNNPLVGHFGIDKIRELVGRKYYWPSLRKDVKTYVRRCNICLTSKTICHKLHGDL